MSQQFTVEADTQRMKSNAEELRGEAQQYHSCALQVLDEGRSLAATWDGPAKQAYMEVLEKDAPEFTTLYQELLEFCDAVVQSANAYETTHSSIASEILTTNRR